MTKSPSVTVTSGGVVMGDEEEEDGGWCEKAHGEKWVPRLGLHAPDSVCGYVLTKHLITVDPKVRRSAGNGWMGRRMGGWTDACPSNMYAHAYEIQERPAVASLKLRCPIMVVRAPEFSPPPLNLRRAVDRTKP